MTHAARRLLPVAFALLALAAMAPGTAAAARRPPPSRTRASATAAPTSGPSRACSARTASRSPSTASSAPPRATAVKAFQTANGLDRQRGSSATPPGRSSIVGLRPGATGEAVKVVQRQLNDEAPRRPGGRWRLRDGDADRGHRLPEAHGDDAARRTSAPVTWRKLLWHYDYPSFSAAATCATTASATARRTGRPARRSASSRRRRRAFAARPATAASRSATPATSTAATSRSTQTHEVGLDVDVRPIRDAENQCTWGTNWRFASYDRAATRTLIKTIRAAAPGHVKLIYFNDPVLIREGLTTWYSGHDDHLHIRYCEPSYPIARVPLLSGQGSAIFSVMSLANRPGWRPPSTT